MATPIKYIQLTNDTPKHDDAVSITATLINEDGSVIDPTKLGGGIADGSISEAQLAEGAVGTKNIQDDSVTNAKLAPNAVETAAVKDGAITAAKLASGVVPGLASTTTAGTVKKAATLAPVPAAAGENWTKAELDAQRLVINNLIAQLKAAGIMA